VAGRSRSDSIPVRLHSVQRNGRFASHYFIAREYKGAADVLSAASELMPRRTKEEAELTRERILDAAEVVFLDKGVSAASLEGIARTAGLTRGAIYWHFKDKGAILDALREKVDLPLMELAEACRQQPDHDPLKMARELCALVLHKLEDDEHYRNIHSIFLTRCEYTEGANSHLESQKAVDEECIADITLDFERADAMGRLAPGVTPRVAALTLFSLLHGIFLCWLRHPGRFAIREEGQAMLDLFFGSIENQRS